MKAPFDWKQGVGRLAELKRQMAIWVLKRAARRSYARYRDMVIRMGCGESLAMIVSPRVSAEAARFDKILDQLAELDPDNAPKTRLSYGRNRT